jgi:putative phosphoesterase
MQVGIVSDTHDNLDVAQSAVELFSEHADAVIHCGDFVAPFSASLFDADFDLYAVRGNNDGEGALQNVVREFGVYLGEMGELSFDGLTFAVYHGTSHPVVDALVNCGKYDYVCHGHTHERAHESEGDTVRINPGGIATDPDEGHASAAVLLDTDTGDVEFHDLP